MRRRSGIRARQHGGMARPRQLRRESTLDEMEVQRWAQHNSQCRVAPEHFKDGSLIQRLADEHCELFGQLFHEKRAVFPPRELLLGSACTGSASEVVVANSFQRAVNAVSDSGFRLRPVFSCEIKKEKRKWIAGVHEAFQDACAPSANASASGQGLASGHSVTSGQASSGASCCCIFHDIADLGAARAMCSTHGRSCPVPVCNIFVCCTSCKDFSRMAPPAEAPTGRGPLLLQASSRGSSAQTFHGMLAYITWARPAIVIFENVEAINDTDDSDDLSNLDVVLSELSSRGYECQHMTGDALAYGCPQGRVRLYIVAVMVVANAEFDFITRPVRSTLKTLRALLTVCGRLPPCASQVLYAATDKRVVAYLKERQDLQAARKPCSYAMGNAITQAASSGVSWSAVQQASEWLKASPWCQTLTCQQKQVAAYSLCTDPAPVLFRDVGQTCFRTRLSSIDSEGRHRSFTVTPGQVALVFQAHEEPRLLLGEEAMVLQGFPIAKVSDLVERTSNHVMADLAGNMVAVPVLLALMMAAVACAQW